LRVPVGETRAAREVFDLVDVIAAQTAGVCLLQRHDIKAVDEVCDAIEVTLPPMERQHVPPTAGEIMMITGIGDAELNVVTEDAQPGANAAFGMKCMILGLHEGIIERHHAR
jgi:hypothetical protein